MTQEIASWVGMLWATVFRAHPKEQTTGCQSIHSGEYISRGIQKIRLIGPSNGIPTGWAFLPKEYGI